jgi:hypothetical protein
MLWKEKTFNEGKYKSLIDSGLYSVFAKILANRDVGVTTKKDIKRYIDSPLEDLEDPGSIAGVNAARDIITSFKSLIKIMI